MLNIPHGTTLAFDFGETRIGVAQGDAEVGIAHPLATISGEGNDKKFAAIAALVAEWRPVQFVVGLPLSTDGSEHEMTRLARKFGHRLHGIAFAHMQRNAALGQPRLQITQALPNKIAPPHRERAFVRPHIQAKQRAATAGSRLQGWLIVGAQVLAKPD